MAKFAVTALAAIALANAVVAVADQPRPLKAKPSSFVPHPHTGHHVYGAPIRPPIVGHAKPSHQRNKPPSIRPNRGGS
jgi:hypothetical protein